MNRELIYQVRNYPDKKIRHTPTQIVELISLGKYIYIYIYIYIYRIEFNAKIILISKMQNSVHNKAEQYHSIFKHKIKPYDSEFHVEL